MSLLWDFLCWISHFDLIANSSNILGFFWLLSLMILGYVRFKAHFEQNNIFPKSTGIKRKLWFFIPLLWSFLWVFLMQILLDDGITTPISLIFGSWSLMKNDPFTLGKLLGHKIDVYLDIAMLLLLFSWFGIWRFLHFTKKSFFWLSLTIAFDVLILSQHIFNFRALQGDAYVWTFWITYPWSRILSGFFCASLLKKTEPQK